MTNPAHSVPLRIRSADRARHAVSEGLSDLWDHLRSQSIDLLAHGEFVVTVRSPEGDTVATAKITPLEDVSDVAVERYFAFWVDGPPQLDVRGDDPYRMVAHLE